jgi:hypothetical protein
MKRILQSLGALFIVLSCTSSAFSQYGGGPNDGFASGSTAAKSALSGESLSVLYGGGFDDGFACRRMVAKSGLGGESMSALFQGGQDDGFAYDKLPARTALTGESMSQLFGGGQNDGFACDKLSTRTFLTGESMSQLFSGGQDDGFACDGSAGVPITPLSLRLLRFDAIPQATTVLLHWSTIQEQNNDFFTVERSVDGIVFESIGRVYSIGNSQAVQSYELLDGSPLEGVSWYRLSWTDFDGRSKNSELKMVLFDKTATSHFSIFPNPSNGHAFNVVLTGEIASDDWELHLLDVHGRTVFVASGPKVLPEEYAHFKLPSPFAAGSYLVQIRTEKRELSGRLLILGQ